MNVHVNIDASADALVEALVVIVPQHVTVPVDCVIATITTEYVTLWEQIIVKLYGPTLYAAVDNCATWVRPMPVVVSTPGDCRRALTMVPSGLIVDPAFPTLQADVIAYADARSKSFYGVVNDIDYDRGADTSVHAAAVAENERAQNVTWMEQQSAIVERDIRDDTTDLTALNAEYVDATAGVQANIDIMYGSAQAVEIRGRQYAAGLADMLSWLLLNTVYKDSEPAPEEPDKAAVLKQDEVEAFDRGVDSLVGEIADTEAKAAAKIEVIERKLQALTLFDPDTPMYIGGFMMGWGYPGPPTGNDSYVSNFSKDMKDNYNAMSKDLSKLDADFDKEVNFINKLLGR